MKVELLVVLLTSRCNLHCSYCYLNCTEKGEDLTLKTLHLLINRLETPPREIVLSGGEPTLIPDLLKAAIKLLREKFPRSLLSLQTNGTLLDRALVSFCREMKVGLGLSIDGPPEINDLSRGETKKTLQGLKLLEEEGLACGVTVTVTQKNVSFLGETALFLGLFAPVASLGLDLLRPAGRGQERDLPRASQLWQSLEGLEKALCFLRQKGRFLSWREKNLQTSPKGYCPAVRGRSLVLTPNAELYPCASLVGRKEFLLGTADGSFSTLPLGNGCLSCNPLCPGRCPSRSLLSPRAGELDCVVRHFFRLRSKEAL